MNKLQILWALTKKEFFVLTDPRMRISLFIIPFVMLFIFSYAVTLEVKNISIAVFNQDNGKHGHEIVQRVLGSPYFKNVLIKSNADQIQEAIEQEDALIAVNIPQDFSRKIMKGESGVAEVIVDGRRSNSSIIAGGYFDNIVEKYNYELIENNSKAPPPPQLITRNWYNQNLDYLLFTIASLVGLVGMIGAQALTSASITREKEYGTLDLLRVSPILPYQVLIGKALPALVIGIVQSITMMSLSIIVFGVEIQGSIILLYVSLTIFLLATIGIGLMLSSLASTMQRAGLYSFIFISPTNILSGFASPIENMPIWLQYFVEIIPLKHFILVSRGIVLKAMPFEEVMRHTYPNIIISIITLSLAAYFYKKKTE